MLFVQDSIHHHSSTETYTWDVSRYVTNIFFARLFVIRTRAKATLLYYLQSKPALTNLSFSLGVDTSPDALWLQKATAENLEFQTEMNKITGRSELQQAVDGTDGVAKTEEGYSWTQTEEELEIVVPLPEGATSKDVNVKYLPKSMEVKCKKEPLVSLSLFARVDPDGCTWTLDRDGNNSKLVITMEKADPTSWPRITP